VCAGVSVRHPHLIMHAPVCMCISVRRCECASPSSNNARSCVYVHECA